MASLCKDRVGTRRILFIDREGVRRTLRLGRVSKRTAETILDRVERLVADSFEGTAHDPDLAKWIADLPPVLHRRLARVGLVAPRAGAAPEATLGELVNKFLERSSAKPGTRKVYDQCSDALLAFFGADAPLSTIIAERADEYRSWLSAPHKALVGRARTPVVKALAIATQAKRIEVARQIFARGLRWKMIETNPFDGVRGGSKVNAARMHYVSRQDAEKLVAACRTPQWAAIVGLARYAGLRVPSELVGLRWTDLAPRATGEKRQMFLRVTSEKTKHHGGHHAERLVPVCGELLSILEHCRAATEPGETRIVPSVADGAANLRTEFLRLIARAGLEVWEKPFQNCRSSCECDWLEQFPGRIAAIARWMGHSPTVAMKHYAQVLPHHADGAAADAAEWADPECAHLTRALPTAKNAQNPAQQGAEPGGMERQSEKPEPRNSRKKPHSLRQTEEWKANRVGATGFEPATSTSRT